MRKLPLDPRRDLLDFMPRFNTKTIIDIQYALLTYRNMQPNSEMPSLQFFHYNNLLNKDQADQKLDPWAATRGLKMGNR